MPVLNASFGLDVLTCVYSYSGENTFGEEA